MQSSILENAYASPGELSTAFSPKILFFVRQILLLPHALSLIAIPRDSSALTEYVF